MGCCTSNSKPPPWGRPRHVSRGSEAKHRSSLQVDFLISKISGTFLEASQNWEPQKWSVYYYKWFITRLFGMSPILRKHRMGSQNIAVSPARTVSFIQNLRSDGGAAGRQFFSRGTPHGSENFIATCPSPGWAFQWIIYPGLVQNCQLNFVGKCISLNHHERLTTNWRFTIQELGNHWSPRPFDSSTEVNILWVTINGPQPLLHSVIVVVTWMPFVLRRDTGCKHT